MKIQSSCLALILAFIAFPHSTQAAPPLNTPCEIELRRDATGPGINSGTRVGFSGKLQSVDEDWICIDAGEQGEVWIPVASIQFIHITSKKAQ